MNDPGGVWASNINDFSERDMRIGLVALQRWDDRYMPNAPNVRKIIRDAVLRVDQYVNPAEPDDRRDDIDIMFVRLRSYNWMEYVKKMTIKRARTISETEARACCEVSKKVIQPYERAWRTNEDHGKESWRLISVAATNALLKAWNQIVDAKYPIRQYEELYAEV